jgi:hypothetical protein
MKDKPTLDDLFESKKLDLPDEEFWNGFQDRVKGRAIASLGERSKSARLRKVGLYATLPALVLTFVGLGLIESDSTRSSELSGVSPVPSVTEADTSFSQLASLLEGEGTYDRESVVQLASLNSFDSFANSSVQLAGGDSSFNHHSLSLSRNPIHSAQYTF